MSDFQFQVMVSSQQYHKFTNCMSEISVLQKRMKELQDQLEKNHERRDLMQLTIKNMQIKIKELSKNSLKLSRGLICEKQDHEKTQQNAITRERQLLEKVLTLTRERDLSYQNIDMLKQSLKKLTKEVENGKQNKRLLECKYKETVSICEKVMQENKSIKENNQKLVMVNKQLQDSIQQSICDQKNSIEQNKRLLVEISSKNELLFMKQKDYQQEIKLLSIELQSYRNRYQCLFINKEKDTKQFERQVNAKNNEIDQLIQQNTRQISIMKDLQQSNQKYKRIKNTFSIKCQILSQNILAMKEQWKQLLLWCGNIRMMNFNSFGVEILSYMSQLIQKNTKRYQQLKSLSYWEYIMPQLLDKKLALQKDKISEKYQVLEIQFKLLLGQIESSFKRWLNSC